MKNWWKNPVLQGEDNDYGQYDYLIEELPHDEARWEWLYKKCDSCGKYHRLNFYSNHYFYTYDGWDSFDYTDCWECRFKDKVWSIKNKIKKEIKAHKLAFSLLNRKLSIKRNIEHYKLGLKIARS
nr:MAG TPA: hypothetical protein [Caudoviricetes sp.]